MSCCAWSWPVVEVMNAPSTPLAAPLVLVGAARDRPDLVRRAAAEVAGVAEARPVEPREALAPPVLPAAAVARVPRALAASTVASEVQQAVRVARQAAPVVQRAVPAARPVGVAVAAVRPPAIPLRPCARRIPVRVGVRRELSTKVQPHRPHVLRSIRRN